MLRKLLYALGLRRRPAGMVTVREFGPQFIRLPVIAALVLLAGSVQAQVPNVPSGCGLGVTAIVADVAAFSACLDQGVKKSDWENFSLATAGPVLWPGNEAAEANSRAWMDQVTHDLLGWRGGFTHQGGPQDVGSAQITRNAQYSGGIPGWVNSGFRVTTNVGPNATSFEWSLLGIVNSAASGGENVGVYGQANGSGAGPMWGGVWECNQTGTGNCVGGEVDVRKPAGSPGRAIGIDIVDKGNGEVAIRSSSGMRIWEDPIFRDTHIDSVVGGGLKITVHGRVVADWE